MNSAMTLPGCVCLSALLATLAAEAAEATTGGSCATAGTSWLQLKGSVRVEAHGEHGELVSSWEVFNGTNCYLHHGAEGIAGKDPVPGRLSREECQAECLKEPECQGIVMPHGTASEARHTCWLRKNIVKDRCRQDQPYTFWLRPDARLATRVQSACCAAWNAWPDVDGVTCPGCMALVLTEPYGGRCDRYCESFGHVCYQAAEEMNENCEVKYASSCDVPITGTSDMLCSCRLAEATDDPGCDWPKPEPAPSPAPTPEPTSCCEAFGSWPDVDNGVICKDCMALVLTAPYGGRCDRYCESFGHVCVAAAEEKDENCDVQFSQSCDQPIEGTSDMLCQCVNINAPSSCPSPASTTTAAPTPSPPSPPAPEPASCCEAFGSWPDIDNGVICKDCMALVLTAPYGGRCDRYCESFGHVCVAAAEEKDENCDVQFSQQCNQAIEGTSDMLCKCVKPNASPSCQTAPTTTVGPTPSPDARIQVVGKQLLVDGKPLHMKGVAWNPVPKGGVQPRDLDFAGFVEQDAALMQRMGINVIRTYTAILDWKVLDILWSKGIWVVNSVYNYGGSSAESVAAKVEQTKDHPAILMWSIGNEWNYNGLYVGMSFFDCVARIRDVANVVRRIDSKHPISSIYGDVGRLDQAVDSLPDIDIWGINAYRGISFGSMFGQYDRVSDKPMYLGEYGADAYNAKIRGPDLQAQARATRELTEEILDHSSALNKGSCIGGFIFEFADEWWKDGDGSPNRQDIGGVAPGGGPYPDKTFNEEWWGLVTIDRVVRPAFEAFAATDIPQASQPAQLTALTG